MTSELSLVSRLTLPLRPPGPDDESRGYKSIPRGQTSTSSLVVLIRAHQACKPIFRAEVTVIAHDNLPFTVRSSIDIIQSPIPFPIILVCVISYIFLFKSETPPVESEALLPLQSP
jgi:hypothetical protein